LGWFGIQPVKTVRSSLWMLPGFRTGMTHDGMVAACPQQHPARRKVPSFTPQNLLQFVSVC